MHIVQPDEAREEQMQSLWTHPLWRLAMRGSHSPLERGHPPGKGYQLLLAKSLPTLAVVSERFRCATPHPLQPPLPLIPLPQLVRFIPRVLIFGIEAMAMQTRRRRRRRPRPPGIAPRAAGLANSATVTDHHLALQFLEGVGVVSIIHAD